MFLISAQKHMSWVLIRSTSGGASNEYSQHMFSWRNKKNISTFYLKKVSYLKLWNQLQPSVRVVTMACLGRIFNKVSINLFLICSGTIFNILPSMVYG